MTELITKALEAERNGDLEAAAKFYAVYAFQELVGSNYQVGQEMRRGLTHMLESISADVRADNYDRARTHLQMIEPMLRKLQRNTDEKPIQGLASEWLGDAKLMVGDDDAIEHYEQALETFQSLSINDRLFWGAEPEFDNAYGAMKEFLAVYGIQYPNRYTLEFEDRVQKKIDAWTTNSDLNASLCEE